MHVIARLAHNLLRILTWPLWSLVLWLRRSRASWLELRLHGAIAEHPPPPAPWPGRLLARATQRPTAVQTIRRATRQLEREPAIQGVCITLGHLAAGWATLASLRRELSAMVKAGKRVVVFLPEGAGQRELFVASVASQLVAPEPSSFLTPGPQGARTFVADALSRLGVQMEVTALGRFKSAADALVRETMSDAEREQTRALVSTVHDVWTGALSERSALGHEGAGRLLEEAVYGAPRAKELGVIDDCAYADQLQKELGLDSPERPALSMARLRRRERRPVWLPLRKRPRVALLVLRGPIAERTGPSGGIALKSTSEAIERLRKRADVQGVILSINSPGGSALTSDLLHHELTRLGEDKPLVAMMGDVAASGGYYLAAAARRIVAQPTTLTGSIGVISVHAVLRDLFARLGARHEVVKLTPMADIYSTWRDPTALERERLHAQAERCYERFLEVVAAGRGLSLDAVREVAEGRVWSGRDAKERGLVDVLGGYHEAREELCSMLPNGGRDCDPEPSMVWAERPPSLLPARLPRAGSLELARALELVQLVRRSAQAPVLAYALDLPQLS